MEEILSEGLDADHVTWNSAISACESGEQWAQALQMLHRARSSLAGERLAVSQNLKRGTNSAISACAKASHWEAGLQLLQISKEEGAHSVEQDTLCSNSLLLQMTGSYWKTTVCLLHEMSAQGFVGDLVTQRGCICIFQAGACHRQFLIHVSKSALELVSHVSLGSLDWYKHEEHTIEVALAASRLRLLDRMPRVAERMVQRCLEAPALTSLKILSLRKGWSPTAAQLNICCGWHITVIPKSLPVRGIKDLQVATVSAHHRIHDAMLAICSSIGPAFVRCCVERREFVPRGPPRT